MRKFQLLLGLAKDLRSTLKHHRPEKTEFTVGREDRTCSSQPFGTSIIRQWNPRTSRPVGMDLPTGKGVTLGVDKN